MIFQQFRHEQGGCLSYLIGCSQLQVCVVVDPQLDIDLYLHYASEHRMKITHILETHSHADHLSGAKNLSEATGAPVYFHESVKAAYPFTGIRDGQELTVGNIILKILHTPGHTQDSICILVSDTVRGKEPWLVLTGDTLFVGDTGRPDLDGSAERLYDSIWKKLLPLPDGVEIYPTHFAGSLCGKGMSPKPNSTIGFERKFNPALQLSGRNEFVQFVTSDLPVQPPRFHQVRQYNLGFLAEPPIEKTYDIGDVQITVDQLKAKREKGERFFLLDVREPFEAETASIGGKLIPLQQIPNRFKELDPNQEIIVYCHHGSRSRQAVEFLSGKGFGNVKTLVGGINEWSRQIDPGVPQY